MKQKAETPKGWNLKPEGGKRKAKTRGVKKEGREEQEDGEGNPSGTTGQFPQKLA
jgi:hypothetical protein